MIEIHVYLFQNLQMRPEVMARFYLLYRDKYYILSGVAPINLNVLETIVEKIGAATWPP